MSHAVGDVGLVILYRNGREGKLLFMLNLGIPPPRFIPRTLPGSWRGHNSRRNIWCNSRCKAGTPPPLPARLMGPRRQQEAQSLSGDCWPAAMTEPGVEAGAASLFLLHS